MKKIIQTYKPFLVTMIIFIVLWGVFEIISNKNLSRMKETILDINCEIINADPSRPEERVCIKPVSIHDGLFKFQTANGKFEIYEIVILENEGQHLVFKNYSDK